MNRFCLFGFPVKHSISPELHQMMFNLTDSNGNYDLMEVSPEKLKEAFIHAKSSYNGINLTIPHKQAVIPLLDEIDPSAKELNSVNTVLFKDGKAIGFNTDIYGVQSTFESNGINIRGKNVLLLGAGGAAKTIAYFCKRAGARVYVQGRDLGKAMRFAEALGVQTANAGLSYQILINATPVGMFPNVESSPLKDLKVLDTVEFVYDAIYNPEQTLLLKLAKEYEGGEGRKCANGLEMLTVQGIRAHQIWRGDAGLSSPIIHATLKLGLQILMSKKNNDSNIVLCGFMGSGKSTIGKYLAKALGKTFVDTDELIIAREGRSINDIFATDGEAYFRKIETDLLKELGAKTNLVISTGGGMLEAPENQELVKNQLVVWLDVPLCEIVKRLENDDSRPLMKQPLEKIEELFIRRTKLYKDISDIRF